jgi:transcriptional regulator GlxA family with amidase domain
MDHRVTAAISIMHRQLVGGVSILRLSRSVNLSSSRLRQLFKEDTGRSPMQYLQDLRMRNAENMLRSTFLSVKEIGFLSGWTDLSHFVRCFKKQYGVTPSEFRVRTPLSATSLTGRSGE